MAEMEGVEQVIKDSSKFKTKLGIGEDAYDTLRRRKLVEKGVRIVNLGGAFGTGWLFASSPVIAATFFAPTGLLATLGIGAAAVTPIGWVIAAGVASAGGYYGIDRYVRGGRKGRVVTAPVTINTQLKLLAVGLFDFLAPLGLKVAALDGRISDSERRRITDYFVEDWGYYPEFVQKELPDKAHDIENLRVAELVSDMIEYQISNPDCNYEALSEELTGFLQEVTRADGEIHDLEVIFIQWLEIALAKGKPGYLDGLRSAFGLGERDGNNANEERGSDPIPNEGEEAARSDDVQYDGPSEGGAQRGLGSAGRSVGRALRWLTE